MSLDAAVYIYFPAAQASAALRALQGMLAAEPGTRKPRTLKVLTPEGEKVALPFQEGLGIDARKTYDLAEEGSIEVDTLLDPEKGQNPGAIFPVDLELTLGDEYLEIAFTSIASEMVHLLYLPSVRARIGELLGAGQGIAAVSLAMGEWRTYASDEADDKPFDVPDGHSRDEAGPEEFAAFLVDRRRSGG